MSSTITCTRRLEWDALHRIPIHENKCRAFHGHRYVAEITCCARELDQAGRVIDFGVVKSKVGGWIDENLDHTAILARDDDDPATNALINSNAAVGRPVYLMDSYPTAENLAVEVAKIAQKLLREARIEVIRVTVWETPNCHATWER